MDRFVAKQYGNRLPALPRKKGSAVQIASSISIHSDKISFTDTKTSNMLPLLFYWQWDYKNTCAINPAIPVRNFTKTVFSQERKLDQKLNGRRLELTIEQLPHVFAIDDKAHMIWVIYAFGWDRVSLQPEIKDLTVSYKLLQNSNVVKSGRITVQDKEKETGIGMFQSWKNATASYLARYNHDITSMTRLFMDKLVKEL